MSLSELETLHQLCELERSQVLQSLALAVLKIPYAGYCYQETDQISLITKETFNGFILVPKSITTICFLKMNVVTKKFPYSTKIKYILLIHFQDEHFFGVTAVPCGSENSHNVVQLNPDEEKYYSLIPYPTLMQPLKKFSPESFRAIARNPNIDLRSIGTYSKSDIQHHKRTQ